MGYWNKDGVWVDDTGLNQNVSNLGGFNLGDQSDGVAAPASGLPGHLSSNTYDWTYDPNLPESRTNVPPGGLTGLTDPTDTATGGGETGGGESGGGEIVGGYNWRSLRMALNQGLNAFLNLQRGYKDRAPYRQAGTAALDELTKISKGEYNVQDSPEFKSAYGTGLNALQSLAAARGGLFSGRAGMEAERYGQGLATQTLGNTVNRLLDVAKLQGPDYLPGSSGGITQEYYDEQIAAMDAQGV